MGELNEQKQALMMGGNNNLPDIGYPDGRFIRYRV